MSEGRVGSQSICGVGAMNWDEGRHQVPVSGLGAQATGQDSLVSLLRRLARGVFKHRR